MSELPTVSDFELWTYQQPCDFFEMCEGSQRKMYDNHMAQKARIKELESTPTGKAPCIKFCEATAFRSEMAKKDDRISYLESFISDVSVTFGGIEHPSVKIIVGACRNLMPEDES